jgi:hypothetical protein
MKFRFIIHLRCMMVTLLSGLFVFCMRSHVKIQSSSRCGLSRNAWFLDATNICVCLQSLD